MSNNTAKHLKVRDTALQKYRQYSSKRNYARYTAFWNRVYVLVMRDHDRDRNAAFRSFKGCPKNSTLTREACREWLQRVKASTVDQTDQEAADNLCQTFEEVFVKDDKANDHPVDHRQCCWTGRAAVAHFAEVLWSAYFYRIQIDIYVFYIQERSEMWIRELSTSFGNLGAMQGNWVHY